MALTKEQLISKGLQEDVATQVLPIINALFKETLDNNYVSKESFNNVNTKKNELQTQLDTANAEVTRLKPFEQQVQTLNDEVTTLKNDKSALQQKYDNQAMVLMTENLIRNELTPLVVDMEDVLPKIDMSKVVIKDNKIESGLTEQIESLKTAKPHYFKIEQNQNNSFFGFKPPESNNNLGSKDSEDVAFAKSLAQSRIEQTKLSKSASESYFKGGIN